MDAVPQLLKKVDKVTTISYTYGAQLDGMHQKKKTDKIHERWDAYIPYMVNIYHISGRYMLNNIL